MNREILFRGKLLAGSGKGEWTEGCLKIWPDNTMSILPDNTVKGVYGAIDPNTVARYTGLTDKNGVKIFEGDIINDIDYGIMKCIYLHGSFVWYKEDGFKIECMKYVPTIEIIGNIFDDPELIGE